MPTPPKQATVMFPEVPKVTESELRKLVGWYIVEEMLTLSTVESPSFRRILVNKHKYMWGSPTEKLSKP